MLLKRTNTFQLLSYVSFATAPSSRPFDNLWEILCVLSPSRTLRLRNSSYQLWINCNRVSKTYRLANAGSSALPSSRNPSQGTGTAGSSLLKRASHDTFPNAWELPGGHLETDETIEDAVRREVKEETGLVVAEIIGEVNPMTWKSKTKSNVQLNYVVTVKPGGTVKLDLEEHSDWRWASREELESLYTTPEMEKVVQDALDFTVGSA